jgi:hypothetical protein
MEDHRRIIIPCIAIVFLVLVLMPTLMVRAGKYPRLTMTPRTQQQLRKFFKNHASDMADLLPSQGQQGGSSYDDQSEPGSGQQGSKPAGDGSNGGQSRQAPATNAGMFLYSYQVGTPPQSVSGALDISSELVWTQCGSCATCGVTPATPFYSTLSTTMAVVRCTSDVCQNFAAQNCSADVPGCGYMYMYRGGEANTTGYLATESFTFDTTRVDDVVFGCGLDSVGDFGGASGVIGLGRGPLSLVSQLDAGRFSYYFAPDGDTDTDTQSFILFGDDATPQTKRALTTPLLASDDYPNIYLVGLTGIHVDGKDLGIPRGMFDLRKDGSGGVVLSIAVPVTFLEEGAYKLLRQALVSRIRLPTVNGSALGLDVCYASQSLATAKIPGMALVFDGNAVMELEVGNYFYMDASSGLECLTILPSPDGHVSLLGSLIQAGTHMIYDIHGSTLAFESLQQASSSSPPPLPSNNSYQGTPGHRLSSAPPPHMSLPMLFAHFLWVTVYMVL